MSNSEIKYSNSEIECIKDLLDIYSKYKYAYYKDCLIDDLLVIAECTGEYKRVCKVCKYNVIIHCVRHNEFIECLV